MNLLNLITRRRPAPLPKGERTPPTLKGDRDIEWSFIVARVGRFVTADSHVLDFGCGLGTLAMVAAQLGARVLAIDLMPRRVPYTFDNLDFEQVDVADLPDSRKFDLVINCSTIEHVGLAGRYNSKDAADGDVDAMRRLHELIVPGGHMLLTLPLGPDQVIAPLHRTYGTQRLPRLLQGYDVLESAAWRKTDDPCDEWIGCTVDEAQQTVGNDHYYAIGGFVLRRPG